MEADWFHIDLEEYITLVRCRTQVIWLGQFIDIDNLKTIFEVNRIQARALRLRSKPDWISFIGTCYSLACVNEKDNWKSVSGQKYRFLDWMSRGRKDLSYFEFDERKFIDPVFCTVFDTKRNKRLIVDGLHSSTASKIRRSWLCPIVNLCPKIYSFPSLVCLLLVPSVVQVYVG